jgi:hypothetical protein
MPFLIYFIAAPSCSATPLSNLRVSTGASAPCSWALFSYNRMTNTTAPTLVFGFQNGGADYTSLDDVSVVDTSAPLIQLLDNPSFENSTSVLNGWITWCQSSCGGSGNEGKVSTSGCYSGNCYIDHCQKNNYDYLTQSFSATIGNTYTISFRLCQIVGGAGKFYANLYD